jgi:hypothetical protein
MTVGKPTCSVDSSGQTLKLLEDLHTDGSQRDKILFVKQRSYVCKLAIQI